VRTAALESGFGIGDAAIRPGVEPRIISAWEHRHGYHLPSSLKNWLQLSNGLYRIGPLVHPISAIGPMVPFARVPDMLVQPESWFELGNPNIETICIDLSYRRPGGGHPIFTSGDDATGSSPRIIASSFEEWFLAVLRSGGHEYWFDSNFVDLGDPWLEHRRHAPAPRLPERLQRFAPEVRTMIRPGADELAIADRLGISRMDVELIFRHLQHATPDLAAS
jgi:hypothetical protein